MDIRLGRINDLEQITELVYKYNNNELYHIAYCCKNYENIYKDFKDLIDSKDNLVVTAWNEGKLYGVLGLYNIEEIKRVDCIGPFIDCKTESDFILCAKKIIEFTAKKYIGYKFSFNINTKNIQCLELMKDIQAEAEDYELELILNKEKYVSKSNNSITVEYSNEYEEEVKSLHSKIAPDFYLASNQLINSIGNERKVYLVLSESKVVGYGVMQFHETTNKEVCIEIIGVDEEYRGKAYGNAIMNRLLNEAFNIPTIEFVKLVVDDINEIALNLYNSYGFEKLQETNSFSYKTR